MILDKTSIEEILCTDGEKFEKFSKDRKDGIYIRTNTDQNYFDADDQIGNDSIDLRIADYGYVMKCDYEYINTLSDQAYDIFYKRVELTRNGYILKPGDLLFVPTYERIALSGNLIGRITGRSVFARMGLSVHCTQDKFSSGINSVAGLQIINNSPIPLKIYPYQKLAQLLIEKTGENRHPYNGVYCQEVNYTLPMVHDKDRHQYNAHDRDNIIKQNPKKMPIWKRKRKEYTLALSKVVTAGVFTLAMGYFGMMGDKTGLLVAGFSNLLMLALMTNIEFSEKSENDDKQG